MFTINEVRIRRLKKGYIGEVLSLRIGLSETYVGGIESEKKDTKYPTKLLPALAIELDCEIHDLIYSGKTENSGKLVEKIIIEIDRRMGPEGMLLALIEAGFFDVARSIREIRDKCNIENEVDKKSNYFSAALTKLVKEEVLEIASENPQKFIKKINI